MNILEDIYNRAITLIEYSFHKLYGLLASYFVLLIILLYIHSQIKTDFDYEWYAYAILYLILTIYWIFFRFKYPKNKKNKTGLVVAIYGESPEERKIKKKFEKELKKIFSKNGLNKIFNIIILKNHLSENINDPEDIKKINKKIRSDIYFVGDVQKEKDGQKEKYFLDLEGMVMHMPSNKNISEEISYDFRNVLPKDINFDTFFGLRGCKITANIIYLAAKYIVGVASFISGNPELALKLHSGLDTEFEKYKQINKSLTEIDGLSSFDLKYLMKIKKKIPLIMSNEYLSISRIDYFYKKEYVSAKINLVSALKYNPNNYEVWLMKSIHDFILDKNPAEALKSIKQAEKYSNGNYVWRYNKTFLMFWSNKFEEAWIECRKIKNNNYPNEYLTAAEIEKFNLEVIEQNKDKVQLFFWLGFTQYTKSNNLPKALQYFEKFIEEADDSMIFLKKKASSFLVDIKREMDIKK